MDETTKTSLQQWLTEYAQLAQDYDTIAAPKVAQIRALEAALDEETTTLNFHMETLKSSIKALILESRQTFSIPTLSARYVHRGKFNTETLLMMAKEMPAIMQAYEDASWVVLRKTKR